MSRTVFVRRVPRTAAVAVLTAVLLAGCPSEVSCSSDGRWADGVQSLAIATGFSVPAASASCVASIEYQGEFYVAWSAKLPVAQGESLGDAVYPPCNDFGVNGCFGDAKGRPTEVWEMRGVDPAHVLVGLEQGTGRLVVYGRSDADPEDYFRFSKGAWHVR